MHGGLGDGGLDRARYPRPTGRVASCGTGAPVPDDPALPLLASLVDGRQVAEWVAGALPGRRVEARPRYIRHKPANKAAVLYEMALDGQSTTAVLSVKVGDPSRVLARPEARRLVAAARRRCLSSDPLMFLEEPGVLVEWYPARVAIPGLAFDPCRLGDQLEAAGHPRPEQDPILVSHKPESRAVQRWGSLYLKAYVQEEQYQLALRGLERSAALQGVCVAAPVAAIPEQRLTIQSEVVGGGAVTSMAALGEALSRLHAAPPVAALPVVAADDRLDLARSTATQLAWMLPDLVGPLDSLLEALRRSAPRPGSRRVLSHGDVKLDNALLTPAGVALLDFDHMCMAEAASDAAMAAADLVSGAPDDLAAATRALEELSSGYGHRPTGVMWHTAVSVLSRAIYPFRRLEPDWPARIRRMVGDAAELAEAA